MCLTQQTSKVISGANKQKYFNGEIYPTIWYGLTSLTRHLIYPEPRFSGLEN